MEGKKEELREMVGRRYRDVLEASSEVRNIRKLAETLAEAVSNARTTQSVVEPRPLTREQQASVQRFIALHKLVAMIGDPDGDALSDAFALTLAELLHKELATEPLSPSVHFGFFGVGQNSALKSVADAFRCIRSHWTAYSYTASATC
ncbi:unnamed protein product [Strongylus vulgaris]|uniref:Uncharacterized protein n=1 Tax=Strongylus vulgaris TaxID=40348 RepID=A0A3P7IY48_STRVU|nr:unnamed protein product [Strongylus vulgaris]